MKKILLRELDENLLEDVTPYLNVFAKLHDDMHIEIFYSLENIFRFNEDVTKFHYLIRGKAKITMVHEDGKRSIVHFVNPHEFIGELTLIGIEDAPKDVTAISDCICLTVSLAQAQSVLLKSKTFLLTLSQYIGKKLLTRTWFNMKFRNYELKNRLAAYMLMSENNGVYNEKHTETAEYLSVSYRHLLHTLKQYIDDRTITKLPRGYLLDIDQLEILSKDILE